MPLPGLLMAATQLELTQYEDSDDSDLDLPTLSEAFELDNELKRAGLRGLWEAWEQKQKRKRKTVNVCYSHFQY